MDGKEKCPSEMFKLNVRTRKLKQDVQRSEQDAQVKRSSNMPNRDAQAKKFKQDAQTKFSPSVRMAKILGRKSIQTKTDAFALLFLGASASTSA